MTEILVRFVHLSDTHISHDPADGAGRAPYTPAENARRLVAAINALPFTPDFILHTGDVAYDPTPERYELARAIFAPLRAPIRYLPGNHDDTAMMQRLLMGREPIIPYDDTFEIQGVQFILVDSHQPVDVDMPYSRLNDAQLARLEALCSAHDTRPLVVATHHNVLPNGSPWWDGYMRMQNGEAFHRALLPARQRLLGVLHGHVHQHVQMVREGITYISSAAAWMSLEGYPDQAETGFDTAALPGFNVISIARTDTGAQMYVRAVSF
jgi:Icc protein